MLKASAGEALVRTSSDGLKSGYGSMWKSRTPARRPVAMTVRLPVGFASVVSVLACDQVGSRVTSFVVFGL